MRSVARHDEDVAPRGDRDLPAEAAGLIDAARSAQRELLALVTALAAGTADGTVILELADAGARLGENAAGLRDLAGALTDTAASQFALAAAHSAGVSEGISIATAKATAPGRGKGRHSVQSPLMRLVTGLIPAGGLLAALRTLGGTLRHSPAAQHTAAAASWAGNHAAAVATGGAATVVLTAALVVPAVTMHPATGAHYAAGGIPAPAASIWAASLIPAPSSSLPPSAHPNANADAKVAGQLGVIPLAPWSPLPSSPPPAVAPTPTPSAGQLAMSSVTADLSSGQQVTITLYAVGGPVTWHAWCTGPDVTLSGGSGTSAPGLPSLLVFSAAPAQDGAATARCHVWPGEFEVSVVLPPLPSPSPSASPTPQPAVTDTPTPDPGSS